MATVALLLIVFIPMLVEARQASRNERAQRARGGIEPAGDVYRIMQIAYPAAFLIMIGEQTIHGGPGASVFAAGVAVFAAAKALKLWAIRSLGPYWTFRVIVVPGSALIDSGPYRYVRHPNYIAVAAELIGTALMTGARVTGPIATLVFVLLMLRRLSVETRALDAILRQQQVRSLKSEVSTEN